MNLAELLMTAFDTLRAAKLRAFLDHARRRSSACWP